jgi:hypothetical protein
MIATLWKLTQVAKQDLLNYGWDYVTEILLYFNLIN